MASEVALEGHCVLIAAPFGRDAPQLQELLSAHGYETLICNGIGELLANFDEQVGAVLLTEEALAADLHRLQAVLAAQPPWSDIPFLLLSARHAGSMRAADAARLRLPDIAASVIVLERPLGSESLLSAVASAMASRQRQFEMRDRLAELAASRDELAAIGMENARLFQEAQRVNQTLEEKVAERTAALNAEMERRAKTEAALRQSQKMEAVGQLTGGIAHDFNNMLTGVIGALDIVKRRIASKRLDDLDRFMEAASTSAQRAAALTERLLAFSRRQSLDPKPTDINGLVASLEDLVRRTIGERITLDLDCDQAQPIGVVDANQLESALLNLVINARDAMPEGGRLTIESDMVEIYDPAHAARQDIRPGRYAVLAVSDTGVGMPPEVIDKAFEPFFTTKPTGQGTGLGLSMVYGFVRQSNGQVRIHSRPGQGTSVKLYLPAADPAQLQGGAPAGAAVSEGQGQAVLIVEDDESVRLIVREVLEELGYVAIDRPDAQAAIPLLASGQPIDLMISDVGLPGMNGRQLAEVARQHRPKLPILFVTGYAENAAIRAGFLGTNMAMISKPFAIPALAAKIVEILQPGRGMDAKP